MCNHSTFFSKSFNMRCLHAQQGGRNQQREIVILCSRRANFAIQNCFNGLPNIHGKRFQDYTTSNRALIDHLGAAEHIGVPRQMSDRL